VNEKKGKIFKKNVPGVGAALHDTFVSVRAQRRENKGGQPPPLAFASEWGVPCTCREEK
jgi:hypothetical protein